MIFIYVQFYPNIHKAAITNTQSVHIHIRIPQHTPQIIASAAASAEERLPNTAAVKMD